jgi:hypothetical protein
MTWFGDSWYRPLYRDNRASSRTYLEQEGAAAAGDEFVDDAVAETAACVLGQGSRRKERGRSGDGHARAVVFDGEAQMPGEGGEGDADVPANTPRRCALDGLGRVADQVDDNALEGFGRQRWSGQRTRCLDGDRCRPSDDGDEQRLDLAQDMGGVESPGRRLGGLYKEWCAWLGLWRGCEEFLYQTVAALGELTEFGYVVAVFRTQNSSGAQKITVEIERSKEVTGVVSEANSLSDTGRNRRTGEAFSRCRFGRKTGGL